MTENTKPLSLKISGILEEILCEGVDVHRCAAAGAIGKIKNPGASKALQKALLDEDEDVRTDAMTALAELADPASGEKILESFLGDPCPEVKLFAIKAFGNINYKPAVPHLLTLVTEQSEEIVWDLDSFHQTGWDDFQDYQLAAIKALGQMGETDVIPEIFKAMDDLEGQDITQTAIPVLANLGNEGIDALAKMIKTDNVRIRRRICAELQPGKSAAGDMLFTVCLADESAEVRHIAVGNLIEHNIDDERLVTFLDDPDADIRALVLSYIGNKHRDKVVEMLGDRSPVVKQAAFRVIASYPELFEKEGFSEIVRNAIAGVPQTAGDAAVAWAALIGEPAAKSLGAALQDPKQPQDFRIGLIEALSLLGDAGFAWLAEAAGDKNRQIRLTALTAIAEIAKEGDWPNKASEALFAALNGDLVEEVEEELGDEEELEADAEVEAQAEADDDELAEADQDENEGEAVSTLDQLLKHGVNDTLPDNGDEEEPEPVELTEEDKKFLELSEQRAMKKGKVSLEVKVAPHQDVRRFAATLLGDFGQPEVPGLLAAAMKEGDDELKHCCLESLSVIGTNGYSLGQDIFEAIKSEALSDDRNMRMLAVRCLGFMQGSEVEDTIAGLCNDDDVHVRLEAVRSIGMKQGHDDILLDALKDTYPGVRTNAGKALAKQQRCMDELIALTLKYDGMHKDEMVELFKQWDRQQAAEKYLNIIENEDQKRVWVVAIQALGDLVGSFSEEEIQAVA